MWSQSQYKESASRRNKLKSLMWSQTKYKKTTRRRNKSKSVMQVKKTQDWSL